MEWFFLILQIVFVLAALVGLSMVSVPLAVVAMGVLGAWAMQRAIVALELSKRNR